MQEKLVCSVTKGWKSGEKVFTVLEAHNTVRFVPGDEPSELEIGRMINEGVSIVLKKRSK